MAKKSVFTRGGREFMAGARASLKKRNIYGNVGQDVEQVRLNDGSLLNIPESMCYKALESLKVNFQAQVPLGGGRALGGALCDFVLPDHGIVIEYQGPFHFTNEGQSRDFWRVLARAQAGFYTVYIYEHDLKNLRKRMLEIIGSPSLAAVMAGR